MSEDISYFERWKEAHLREPESRAEYEREFEAIRVEQKFEEWMSEYRRSYGMYPGAGAYSRRSMRYAFRAGVESQQARITELEAERDRLRELVTELARYAPGVPDWRNMAALLIPSSLVSYAVELTTPKEESRDS